MTGLPEELRNTSFVEQREAPAEAHYFRTLKKFTESQGDEAAAFKSGAQAAIDTITNSGDDVYWVGLQFKRDGNGNRAWYVDLYSCSQAEFKASCEEEAGEWRVS